MNIETSRPRVAVVSPFLDKRHGTERIVVEWITCLSSRFEFHVYSQEVKDLDLSTVVWHRIPKLRGPHLFNYLWWFAANHFRRLWDRHMRGLHYDLVFSPGVNCLDADAVSIHIVFAELLRRVRPELKLRHSSAQSWPLLIHRRLYYRLIVALERRVFTDPRVQLILTSPRTSSELARHYSRQAQFPLICAGVDHETFNVNRRALLRTTARTFLNLEEGQFVLLMIGNDWRKKGLATLLDSLTKIPDLPVQLLVVTAESAAMKREAFAYRSFDSRVRFLPPRRDVEVYYAAADVYTGPSLEDTFALPASEAMACGLPVIMSSRAGVSDFITDGTDGLILENPTDADSLALMVRTLYEDRDFRERLGAKAAETANQFTWEQNGREVEAIFREVISRKSRLQARPVTQES